ncbi:hypothetical protein GCM10009583_16190 [Ornithinicoccus hortensis]
MEVAASGTGARSVTGDDEVMLPTHSQLEAPGSSIGDPAPGAAPLRQHRTRWYDAHLDLLQ